MQNPLKNLLLSLPPQAFRDLKVRLVLLLIFGASTAMVVWSIRYRLPESDRKLERQHSRIAELENQTLELELRWNPQEAEQVAGRFKQSQEQLFAGPEEV